MEEAEVMFFECGCRVTYWAEDNKLKSALSCCTRHEVGSTQRLKNILDRCGMLLIGVSKKLPQTAAEVSA